MHQPSAYIKDLSSDWSSNSPYGASKLVVSSLSNYHNHTDNSPLSIKIVHSGQECYTVDQRKYALEDNAFLIVNANESLTTNVDTSGTTQGVCIYPPSDLVQGACLSLSNALETPATDATTPHFTSRSNQLEGSGKTAAFLRKNLPLVTAQPSTADFEMFYLQLASALVYDQSQLNGKLKQLTQIKKHTQEELYRRLELCKTYLMDNVYEKVSVDELAEIACMSKFHLIRNFKALYGTSPYQFLLHEKLKTAQQLMQQSFSMTDIALQVGFSDSKNLKKALKKYTSN